MQKISIIGVSGSGKTTLGKTLAAKIGAKSLDLDDLYWEPNWKAATDEEFDERLTAAIQVPKWVTSGNYSRMQNRYLAHADTLVWLDYPFSLVLKQALKRTAKRVFTRQVCCNGNYESTRRTFSKDSIILWVFKSYKRRRASAEEIFRPEHFPHLQKLRFRTPTETQRWLDSV